MLKSGVFACGSEDVIQYNTPNTLLVLPDGVIQHNFLQNSVILHACVHGRRKEFFLGEPLGFFQKFFYGRPKVVKFAFYHSKLRKQRFLLKFANSCPSSDTHMFVCRKRSSHTIKKTPLQKFFLKHNSYQTEYF